MTTLAEGTQNLDVFWRWSNGNDGILCGICSRAGGYALAGVEDVYGGTLMFKKTCDPQRLTQDETLEHLSELYNELDTEHKEEFLRRFGLEEA